MRHLLPILLLSLAACGSVDALKLDIVPIDVPPPVTLHPPPPQPMVLVPFVGDVQPPGVTADEPLFCLTMNNYGWLARNTAEMLRWTLDAADLIEYYRGRP